jgi:hypothetical protein
MAAWTGASINLIDFILHGKWPMNDSHELKYTKKKALSSTGTTSEAHGGTFHKISH